MFYDLEKPTKDYNSLKVSLYYSTNENRKGYQVHLQKCFNDNGIYTYYLMPTKTDTRFIQIDNRQRKNKKIEEVYNNLLSKVLDKITKLFEDQKYEELDTFIQQYIKENLNGK